MTEEQAISRLVGCKDILELIEANLQKDATLPLEGATNDQLDNLEQLEAVDPGMFAKAKARRKAGFNLEQVGLLYKQMPFLEQRKIQRSLMGNKE